MGKSTMMNIWKGIDPFLIQETPSLLIFVVGVEEVTYRCEKNHLQDPMLLFFCWCHITLRLLCGFCRRFSGIFTVLADRICNWGIAADQRMAASLLSLSATFPFPKKSGRVLLRRKSIVKAQSHALCSPRHEST